MLLRPGPDPPTDSPLPAIPRRRRRCRCRPPAAAAGLLYRILRSAAPAGCAAGAAAPRAAAGSVSALTKWRRRARLANRFPQPLRHVKLCSGEGPAPWRAPFVRRTRPDWLALRLRGSPLARR